MRDTLRSIGVTRDRLHPRVRRRRSSRARSSSAGSTAASDDYYFHPFVLPQGYPETNLVAGWLKRHATTPFADLVSFQPHLCAQGKAPKQIATPEYAGGGQLRLSPRRGQVRRVPARALRRQAGRAACARPHDRHRRARQRRHRRAAHPRPRRARRRPVRRLHRPAVRWLLGGHFGVPFLSQQHVLFNDTRAGAAGAVCRSSAAPIASQTISTAQSAGWIWDIGLPTRRGVGHVFSSTHTSDEAAERELRATTSTRSGGRAPDVPRRASSASSPAIGGSSGIATAWPSACRPASSSRWKPRRWRWSSCRPAMLSDEMPATRGAMDIVARRFNDAFTYRWERVIDFLKLHYVLSQRDDSDYWRDNRRAGVDSRAPARTAGALAPPAAFALRSAPRRGSVPVGELPVRALRHGLPARAGRVRAAPDDAGSRRRILPRSGAAHAQDAGGAAARNRDLHRPHQDEHGLPRI